MLFIYNNFSYFSFRYCCRKSCLLVSPIAAPLGPLTIGDVTVMNKIFAREPTSRNRDRIPDKAALTSADCPNFNQSREVEKRFICHKMRSCTATAVSSMIFALMCVVSHGKNLIELCRVLFLWSVSVIFRQCC